MVNQLATGAVVLSLPLLLFSTDLRQVRKKGLSVFFALFVGAVAVVASATACHFVFRSRLTPEAWKVRPGPLPPKPAVHGQCNRVMPRPRPQITALMTAVLIGGTPNMASVRTALGIDSELYVTVHTAEVVVGAVYVLLIMVCAAPHRKAGCTVTLTCPAQTVAKPVLSRVLPPYKPLASAAKADAVPGRELEPVASILEGGEAGPEPECAVEPKQAGDESGEPGGSCCTGGDNSGDSDAMAATAHDLTRLQDGVEPYAELTRREFAVPLVGAVALDLLIVLVSAGAGLLFQPYGYFELVTILLITTLSVAASCAERLRRIRHTFTLGQLFILVFCLSVGMLADLKTLAGTSPWVRAPAVDWLCPATDSLFLLVCRYSRSSPPSWSAASPSRSSSSA